MSKTRSKAMNAITTEQAAYIAGILDGEGNITISRKNDHTGMKRGHCYRPMIAVANTNESLLVWLRETTGLGSVTRTSIPKNPRHKRAWRWIAWSNQARQVLESVFPYLVIKKRQAQLMIDFCRSKRDGVGRSGLTDHEWEKQQESHATMRELNRRGTA